MKALILLAIGIVSILCPAYGQLHLIQGSTTPKHAGGYPTSLLAVAEDHTVRTVLEILPSDGTEWIDVSYDRRKAILLSKDPNHSIVVLDFDTASVVKNCEAPPAPPGMGSRPFKEWLADMPLPAKGLVYVESFATGDVSKLLKGIFTSDDETLRGMLVDPAVPCDQSFVAVEKGEVRYSVLHGQAGVAGLGSMNVMNITLEKDGGLDHRWFGGERTYLDYRLPDDVVRDLVRPIVMILAENNEVIGVSIVDGHANERSQLMVFSKVDRTWHRLSDPGARSASVRAFGPWIATAEMRAKNSPKAESAGRAEWKRKDRRAGPDLEPTFQELRGTVPGILHLYDVAGGRKYTIVTNQADSEILLVENQTVYYRVSDRLYTAAIGEKDLSPARLLATSELLRDVHWAFNKR